MSVDEARELYGLLGSLAAAMDEDRYAGADIVRRAAARIWSQRDQAVACGTCDLIGKHDEECGERVEKRMERYEAQCTCSPIKQEYCHVEGCRGGSMLGEYGIKQEREIPVSQLVSGDSVYSPSTKTWHEVCRSTAGQLYFRRDERWMPVDFAADVRFLTRRGDTGAVAGLLFDAFGGEVIEDAS